MSESRKFQIKRIGEFPSKFKSGVIYLEESKNVVHAIAFICPCGCEDLIYLNLLPDAFPRWDFKKNWINQISVYPSIRRKVNCRSHFIIKRNRILWME